MNQLQKNKNYLPRFIVNELFFKEISKQEPFFLKENRKIDMVFIPISLEELDARLIRPNTFNSLTYQ
jgi:hypothetical protein